MDNEKEELIEQYKKLPKDLQRVLASSDIDTAMQEITKRHRLHIDQAGELSDEVGLVLIGVVHPDDFLEDVAFRLRVDKKAAQVIAADVNEHIFKKVRESLMQVHRIDPMMPSNFSEWSKGPQTNVQAAEEPAPDREAALAEMEREMQAKKEPGEGASGSEPLPPVAPAESTLQKQEQGMGMDTDNPVVPASSDQESAEGDIVKKKLGQSFSVPREETEHKETPATNDGKYKGEDPYREPIE